MSLEGWPGPVSLQHRSCPCHWSPAGCRCTYIVINVIFLRKLQKKKITGIILKFVVTWIYQNPLQLKCKFDVPCSAVSPTICCQTPRPNWLPCLVVVLVSANNQNAVGWLWMPTMISLVVNSGGDCLWLIVNGCDRHRPDVESFPPFLHCLSNVHDVSLL